MHTDRRQAIGPSGASRASPRLARRPPEAKPLHARRERASSLVSESGGIEIARAAIDLIVTAVAVQTVRFVVIAPHTNRRRQGMIFE
ncbi:MAG: hypothetical protein BGO98_19320 [Myxococcales bacterium 68-20]|nr:MAG: hypothetical protein BGO98_19320 [Myxococcales bacterium 68-20]